jgi:hypothetical protein
VLPPSAVRCDEKIHHQSSLSLVGEGYKARFSLPRMTLLKPGAALASSLRRELEHNPAAIPPSLVAGLETALVCRAIKIPCRVHSQSRHWIFPIRYAREAVQHGLGAGRIQFEHGPTTWPIPSEVGGTVQVQAVGGVCPVRPSFKGVKHGLPAASIQLEHNPARRMVTAQIVSATCCAVKVPRRVPHQGSLRTGSVRCAREAVQHSLLASTQLEHGSEVGRTARLSGAVQKALGVPS